MKTKRLKGNIINKILITLILLVLVSTLILTLAYFQDKKEYSGTLDFGNIKLKVSGGVNSETSTLVFDTARKKNNDSTWTGKYMPGDMVDLNLTVGLENNSEPAYYIISITDDNDVFESAYYYSDGTKTGNTLNVYVFDRAKTYKQSDTTKTELTGSDLKNVGKLSAGDTNAQNLTISAKIDENFDEQGIKTTVYCKIFAIQQANLSETDARAEIMGNIVGLDTSKYKYVNYLEKAKNVYAFISSGIAPTENMRFVGKMYCERPTSGTDSFLFGSGSSYSNFVGLMVPTQQMVYMGLGSETCYTPRVVPQEDYYNVDFDYEYGSNYLRLKSNLANFSKTFTSAVLNTGDMNVFCINNSNPWLLRIYTFQMYDSGALVRNFVPCLRNSDNKPGMYDTVSRTFFANAGTGEFTWG